MRPTCIWISRFRATFGGKALKIGTLDCSKSSHSKCHLRKYNALPRSVGLLWAPAAWTGSQIIQVRKSGFPVKAIQFDLFILNRYLTCIKHTQFPLWAMHTLKPAGSKRWEGQKPASTYRNTYRRIGPPAIGSFTTVFRALRRRLSPAVGSLGLWSSLQLCPGPLGWSGGGSPGVVPVVTGSCLWCGANPTASSSGAHGWPWDSATQAKTCPRTRTCTVPRWDTF